MVTRVECELTTLVIWVPLHKRTTSLLYHHHHGRLTRFRIAVASFTNRRQTLLSFACCTIAWIPPKAFVMSSINHVLGRPLPLGPYTAPGRRVLLSPPSSVMMWPLAYFILTHKYCCRNLVQSIGNGVHLFCILKDKWFETLLALSHSQVSSLEMPKIAGDECTNSLVKWNPHWFMIKMWSMTKTLGQCLVKSIPLKTRTFSLLFAKLGIENTTQKACTSLEKTGSPVFGFFKIGVNYTMKCKALAKITLQVSCMIILEAHGPSSMPKSMHILCKSGKSAGHRVRMVKIEGDSIILLSIRGLYGKIDAWENRWLCATSWLMSP